jgi:uncharacterized protein YaaR (DUF327 family)
MMRINLYLLLGAFFLVFSCSAKYGKSEFSYAPVPAAAGNGNYESRASGVADNSLLAFDGNYAAEQGISENDLERKIVMTAHVRVRVENLDETDILIKDLMKKYNAYASSTDINDNFRHYSIHVPSPVYEAAIDEINSLGRSLSRSESAEDVTLRYYDLEGRLATKKELLKTFQSYLEKAKTIEEILSVEKRIAELQYEIDGTGKELRNLANRVDYATIDLSVLGPIASSPYRGPTLAERFRELFGSFSGFLSLMLIILVGIVIFGIPILLLLILFFWLLFGKIGLLKKLWRMAAGKKQIT